MTDIKTPPLFEGPTGRKRLLKTYEKCRTECFDDLLYCCAVTIEDAMLLGGGIPGVTYNFAVLFEYGFKLAMERQKLGEGSLITTGIPDSHPGAGLSPKTPSQETAPRNLEQAPNTIVHPVGAYSHLELLKKDIQQAGKSEKEQRKLTDDPLWIRRHWDKAEAYATVVGKITRLQNALKKGCA